MNTRRKILGRDFRNSGTAVVVSHAVSESEIPVELYGLSDFALDSVCLMNN